MNKVLLLGSNERAGLTTCRALGVKGVHVDIVRLGNSTIAEHSRYVNKVYDIANPRLSVSNFVQALIKMLDMQNYDILIPINDAACQICIHYRNEIESKIKIALPDNETMEYSQNKEYLLQTCKELNIPYPEYSTITSMEDIKHYKGSENYPLYLKPIYSAKIINDKLVNFQVKKVSNFMELEEFIIKNIEKVPIMAQKACEGIGVGIYIS